MSAVPAAPRSVAGILPYTLLKKGDSSTLVFLLWRDRKSSAIESSTFWGNMSCPQSKTDVSPLEAVCRVFSEKTKGCFAPATMLYESEHDVDLVARKSPAKQKIEESRLSMRKKLRAGNGVTLLSIRQFVTYVAPVRFVPLADLTASFGADKGEVEWIEAKDLFAALYSSVPDNIVTVRAHPYDVADAQSAKVVTLPLALPFTVSMRTQEARSELAAILKQFNVPLPVDAAATPAAAAAASSSAAAATATAAAVSSDLASLSLGNEAAAASSSASTSASAAAPAASVAADSSALRPAEVNYTCRKCRSVLFTDVSLSAHTMPANGGGRFAHKYIKSSEGGRKVNTACSSLFVEPLLLQAFSGGVEYPAGEGPLLCSKCQTRYGNYVWSGEQCSCGEWIVPAFQVTKSKVDERAVAGPSRANHIQFQFQRPPPRVVPAAAAAAGAPVPAAAAAPTPAAAVAAESKQPEST